MASKVETTQRSARTLATTRSRTSNKPVPPVHAFRWPNNEMPCAIGLYEYERGKQIVCVAGHKAVEYRLIERLDGPPLAEIDTDKVERNGKEEEKEVIAEKFAPRLRLSGRVLAATKSLDTQATNVKPCPLPFGMVQMAIATNNGVIVDILNDRRITIDWAGKELCEWKSPDTLICLAKEDPMRALLFDLRADPTKMTDACVLNQFQTKSPAECIRDISASYYDGNYVVVTLSSRSSAASASRLVLLDVRKSGSAEVFEENIPSKLATCVKFKSTSTAASYLYNHATHLCPSGSIDKLAIGFDRGFMFRELRSGVLCQVGGQSIVESSTTTASSDMWSDASVPAFHNSKEQGTQLAVRRMRWRPIFDDYLATSYTSALTSHIDTWHSSLYTSPVLSLRHHSIDVCDFAWADHRHLVTSGKDGVVKIIDVGDSASTGWSGSYTGRNVIEEAVVSGGNALSSTHNVIFSSTLRGPVLNSEYVKRMCEVHSNRIANEKNNAFQSLEDDAPSLPMPLIRALLGKMRVPANVEEQKGVIENPPSDAQTLKPTESIAATPQLSSKPTEIQPPVSKPEADPNLKKRSVLYTIKQKVLGSSKKTPEPEVPSTSATAAANTKNVNTCNSQNATVPAIAGATDSFSANKIGNGQSVCPKKPKTCFIEMDDALCGALRSLAQSLVPSKLTALTIPCADEPEPSNKRRSKEGPFSILFSVCSNEIISSLLRRANSVRQQKKREAFEALQRQQMKMNSDENNALPVGPTIKERPSTTAHLFNTKIGCPSSGKSPKDADQLAAANHSLGIEPGCVGPSKNGLASSGSASAPLKESSPALCSSNTCNPLEVMQSQTSFCGIGQHSVRSGHLNNLKLSVAPSDALVFALTLVARVCWGQVKILKYQSKELGEDRCRQQKRRKLSSQKNCRDNTNIDVEEAKLQTAIGAWNGLLDVARMTTRFSTMLPTFKAHYLRIKEELSELGDCVGCSVMYLLGIVFETISGESICSNTSSLSCDGSQRYDDLNSVSVVLPNCQGVETVECGPDVDLSSSPFWRARAVEWIVASSHSFRTRRMYANDRELMGVGQMLIPEDVIFSQLLRDYLANNKLECGYCGNGLVLDDTDPAGTIMLSAPASEVGNRTREGGLGLLNYSADDTQIRKSVISNSQSHIYPGGSVPPRIREAEMQSVGASLASYTQRIAGFEAPLLNDKSKPHLHCGCRDAPRSIEINIVSQQSGKTSAHICAICCEVVEGAFHWFPNCGHGAHPAHLQQWVKRAKGADVRCPKCAKVILAADKRRQTTVSFI